MICRTQTNLYSPSYPNDSSCLSMPKDHYVGKGTRHVILGFHGKGGFSYQYAPQLSSVPGKHVPYLADIGNYCTMGIDHSTVDSWGDPGSNTAVDEAYSWLSSTLLMPTTKIGIIGWSMGGLAALNWAARNTSKIAGMWLWAPGSDLRFWRDASGSYSPTYPNANGVTQGTFTTEINNIFGASTTATSASVTIPASGGGGVTLPVASAKEFSDSLLLSGSSLAQGSHTVSGLNFTYTGKTTTSLLGCVSTTTAITVTTGQAITAAYATQSTQYNPWLNAASYTTGNGWTFPVRVAQGTTDVTVPPEMNNHATAGFVARTGNGNFTLSSAAAGHSGIIDQFSNATMAAFFDGLTW